MNMVAPIAINTDAKAAERSRQWQEQKAIKKANRKRLKKEQIKALHAAALANPDSNLVVKVYPRNASGIKPGQPQTPRRVKLLQETIERQQALIKSLMASRNGKGFYDSEQWRRLRYEALKRSNGHCELCGNGREHGAILQVDHIKPRSKFPELEIDPSNLQVLCKPCNLGKSNKDSIDWRKPELKVVGGK